MNMDTMEATHKLYRYLDVYATPDAASANSHHRGGLEITLVLEGPSLMRLRSLSAPQRRWLQRCACNMFFGYPFHIEFRATRHLRGLPHSQWCSRPPRETFGLFVEDWVWSSGCFV